MLLDYLNVGGLLARVWDLCIRSAICPTSRKIEGTEYSTSSFKIFSYWFMGNKISKIKMIFEDNSLSDLQKYKKISDLQNKVSRFWTVVIGLNAIIWPLLFIIPDIEIDNQNSSPIVALKD